VTRHPSRRTSLKAALAVAPVVAAWRFAFEYRRRAGFPRPNPPVHDPADLGLPFEAITVESDGVRLPGWWIPARDGQAGPAVVLVHGWESARDRTLPHAQVLHAAGFHVLTFDVRGHGANGREELPLTAGEFGSDTVAAVRTALVRPDVTTVGVLGHSMGAAGALIAAAAEPRIAALVSVSSPAGPYRLTRHTFRLAHLPIPDVIAYPLAWLTTRIFLRPRGHKVSEVSSTQAARTYLGPLLLVHGTLDDIVPTGHVLRLLHAARSARAAARGRGLEPGPLRLRIIRGGQHSWLYEDRRYRAAIASFLAASLGGPLLPEVAAAAAAAVDARRLPDPAGGLSALDDEPGGIRGLVGAFIRRSRESAPRASAPHPPAPRASALHAPGPGPSAASPR
jgi:alpha-beta hydrolase superfamily lysophospholipase